MTVNSDFFEEIKLSSLFDELPFGMFLFDEDDIIIAANKIFCDIFSVSKKEVEGQSLQKHLPENFEKQIPFKEQIHKQLLELKNKNGKIFQTKIQEFNSSVDSKRVFLGTISDKKSVNRLESELLKQIDLKDSLKDKLEEENELSEMKSRFLSIASHEFRTPLAGILSSLNLISRYHDADQETWFRFKNREKVVNHLDKINESVKNLTTILQKFLTLGNIEKGEIPVKPISFDLRKTITAQTAQFQEICKPGQKITYNHDGSKVTVNLDRHLLKGVMNNLFSNAIKFSPDNSKILVTSKISDKEIYITVKDNGIGIPQTEQNKIFRRFFRARNALTYEEGTGLGLSIVRNYVELMNGKIIFESEENRGTTFNITFINKKK